MKQLKIDFEAAIVETHGDDGIRRHPLGSAAGFAAVSDGWIRAGWDAKYVYSFTWFGRPIIQLPDDIVRIQEVIYALQPDVIIETGVAHGGSLIFYATLCKAMEKGRVVGIDIEIRPHNRKAIEDHPLFPFISLIEGSSVDPSVVAEVRSHVKEGERTLILLDSNHTKTHVLAELQAYAPIVSVGSYIVATDGIMQQVVGAPRTRPEWEWDNPKQAAAQFVRENGDFAIEEPSFPFNEGEVTERVTYWPSAYIKRLR